MGFFDLLTSPIKMEEIRMVLIAKRLYSQMDQGERLFIEDQSNEILASGGHHKKFAELEETDKFAIASLAMAENNWPHNLPGFMWTTIKRPLIVKNYKKQLWDIVKDDIVKRYGS